MVKCHSNGTSQDHKRVGDGDTGLNTGGMGATLAPVVTDDNTPRVMEQVIYPTVRHGPKETAIKASYTLD